MEQDNRPFSVPTHGSCTASCGARLLLLAFILLSLSGWVRMAGTINNWYWLGFASVLPGPLYLAITGGLWGAVGLFAAIWIWQGRAWGRLVGFCAVTFFVISYWIDRLFFAIAPETGVNTPFSLLVTFLVVLVSLLILRPFTALRRPARRHAVAGPPGQ